MSTQDWGKNGPLSKAINEQAQVATESRKKHTWKVYEAKRSPAGSPGQREHVARRSARGFAEHVAVEAMTGEPVRKDDGTAIARALMERAADALPGEEVGPDDVLKKSHGMLLDAFRSTYRRDPRPNDEPFWQAYRGVITEVRREADRQAGRPLRKAHS